MRNHNWRSGVYLLCVIAALAFVGCKKRVAAAPVAAPAVQPAPPAPAPKPATPAPAPVRTPVSAPAPRPEPRRDATPVNVADLFRQNVQTIYFDFDKSDIRPDMVGRLEANASWLKEHPGVKFTIQGACDERGSAEYNLGLGDKRANRVKENLIKEGVDPSVITTVSYGKERPVCREANEQCYQQNRRAGFVMTPAS